MGRVDYSFGSRTVFSEWASISYLLEVILSREIIHLGVGPYFQNGPALATC